MIIKLQILKGGSIKLAEEERYIKEEDAKRLMKAFIKELDRLNAIYKEERLAKKKLKDS